MQKFIFLLALPLATSLITNAQNNSILYSPASQKWKTVDTVYRVEKRVTISMKDATFSQIWRSFFQQTNLSSSIPTSMFNLRKKVDIVLENAPIGKFFSFVEMNFHVDCSIDDEIVVITVEPTRKRHISGIVTDSLLNPLPKTSISVKGKLKGIIADDNGSYQLDGIDDSTILIFSHAGKQTREIKIDTSQSLNVQLYDSDPLPEIVISDGIQTIARRSTTGAYMQPDMTQQQKIPAYNFLDRLNGISIFSVNRRNTILGTQASPFRGATTFSGMQNPPVIVDNFLFRESTDFINGYDVAKITHIKDAVSGALHGTTAANGVTHAELQPYTGKGLQVDINLGIGFTEKPDLNYQAGIDASAWIDMDTSLFRQGLVFDEGPTEKPLRSLLSKEQQGLIGRHELDSALHVFSKRNLRNELRSRMYRTGIAQQYYIALRYGTEKMGLYSSLGKDENKLSQMGNAVSRTTWYTHLGFNYKGFNFSVSNLISSINNRLNFFEVPAAIPIGTLRDKDGRPSALAEQYSDEFLALIIPWPLLNWKYDPLQELDLADHRVNRILFQPTLKLSCQWSHFNISLVHQRGWMHYENRNLHDESSFFNRDLFNRFANYNQWPIPRGSILDTDKINSATSNTRAQLKYTGQINNINLALLGGIEIQKQDIHVDTRRIYAYNMGLNQHSIDFSQEYPVAISGGHEKIPNIDKETDSSDHFLGYFFSSNIRYNEKFILSVSLRKDESNRFSFPLNKKGFPLWAIGSAWLINDVLKARASIGTSGNVNYSLSPFRTIQSVGANSTNNQLYVAGNNFFERLAWEKLTMFNAGFDFKLFHDKLSGSVDLYCKKARDLVQPVQSNPTSGSSLTYNNSGAIRGHGIDINLQSTNIRLAQQLFFSSTLFISYTKNKIVSISRLPATAEQFTDPLNSQGRAGDPPAAIYAYAYGGVNENGDPVGFLDGQRSTDYAKIFADPSAGSIICLGPSTPKLFGSLVISLDWRSFFFTAVVNTKLGHYVRKRALNYTDLVNHVSDGTKDYYDRWQKPGDEEKTKIPALQWPTDSKRDEFFSRSDYNIVSADHVRWHVCQLGYNFGQLFKKK